MHAFVDANGSWDALSATLAALASRPGVKGLLVLASEQMGAAPVSLDPVLQQLAIPAFGGIFPALIAAGHRLDSGYIILPLAFELEVCVLRDIGARPHALLKDLVGGFSAQRQHDSRTVMVFADGLSPGMGALVEALFHVFGLQSNYLGGGSGALGLPGAASLITPQGVLCDAAVVCAGTLQSQVYVAHGWQRLAGPLEVTRSHGNLLESLEGESALAVYRQVLARQGLELDEGEGFYAHAAAHPFGIGRLSGEFVVRDPVALIADGALRCVGDIPHGILLHIMQGNPDTLLAAAATLRRQADAALPAGSWHGIDFVVDCISRASFLGGRIAEELVCLHTPAREQIGAFTLGEIANRGQEYLEFHNKTIVLSALGDPSEST
ncbi:FIST C-terminal domain-containing protein [Craterilacuibacter sp. RT1T]|uniref:FIST signal transduction protein n=1 Tax=Craterilacuibacter sp. RT1T TaxID=2942211 RepID=UPI0020BF8EBC|nr:FIST C-terminal domain-containing protein [Craterilacuibacter sp. RT1T]MCL6264136.1 FIST C-terminal domain-containing protein [Craterilacuibacter sp. RT1T]